MKKLSTALKLEYTLFTDSRLEELENEAREILLKGEAEGAVMSLSGGIDSSVMFHIMKKFNINITDVFFNKAVEPIENQKKLKKYVKHFKNIHRAETRSYKSIIKEYGFPIANKNFSQLCYRLKSMPLSINNIVDKYRIVTGVSPYDVVTGVSPYNLDKKKTRNNYSLEPKYWYLALNYPIQSKCCDILKKQPAKKVNKPMIIGIMADDSLARRRAINSAYHGKFFPLQSWKKQDIFMYAKQEKIDVSEAYLDKWLNEDIKIIGATNTGCVGCHFGQEQNHFIEVKGVRINIKKFDKLELLRPKTYDYYMNMKCQGYTFKEVIKAFEDSRDGKYIEESIKLRNKYIDDILELLPHAVHKKTGKKVPIEAYDLIMSMKL